MKKSNILKEIHRFQGSKSSKSIQALIKLIVMKILDY